MGLLERGEWVGGIEGEGKMSEVDREDGERGRGKHL